MTVKTTKYQIEYNDDTHTYFVNGVKAISATQLVGWKLKGKYAGIDEAILKRAAEYGNRVHQEIEDYEMLGVEADSVELENYKFLKNNFKWEIISSEEIVVVEYKDMFIAGRFDFLAEMNGFKYIFDIKTTSTLDRSSLAMQLSIYKMGCKNTYDLDIDFLGYIWLNSKGNNDYRKFGEVAYNEHFVLGMIEEYYNEVYSKEEKLDFQF